MKRAFFAGLLLAGATGALLFESDHAGCVQRATVRIRIGSQIHPTPEQIAARAERICQDVP